MTCPFCKSKRVTDLKDGTYLCANCDANFDNDPDEGGTHGNDPTRRAERDDERAGRKPKPVRRR
jgi:ribosomal protein L37AE/L43A